ncbi:helix-turn-helix transcriptional regulator [Enterocloster bolteae]|uniref:helix-turn-helix domain-containing protein n=1 Tax=Enterocloster bolteae TaxID=208479 RepID=UPI002A7FCB24|nr:helix-turn-helix transcriptional regulator [Enterocloster bolteae]
MDIDRFAESLRDCMERKTLTGKDLSAISGLSEATVSRYLNSLRSPTSENLSSLSQALDVTTDFLLGLNNDPDSKRLLQCYDSASENDRRIIWAVLSKYERR